MYYKNDIYLKIYQRLLNEQENKTKVNKINFGLALTDYPINKEPKIKINVIRKNNVILECLLHLFDLNATEIGKICASSKIIGEENIKEETDNLNDDRTIVKEFLKKFVEGIKSIKKENENQDDENILKIFTDLKKKMNTFIPNSIIFQNFLYRVCNSDQTLLRVLKEFLNDNKNFEQIFKNYEIPIKGSVKSKLMPSIIKLIIDNPLNKEQKKEVVMNVVASNVEESQSSGLWDWAISSFDKIMKNLFDVEGNFSDDIKKYTKNLNLVMGKKESDPSVFDDFIKKVNEDPKKYEGLDSLKHVMELSALGKKPSAELLEKAKKGLRDELAKENNVSPDKLDAELAEKSKETSDEESDFDFFDEDSFK